MMTSFSLLSLLRIETRKLTGRALLWVEVGLLALFIAALHLALMAVLSQPNPQGMPPEAVNALQASLRWPEGLLSGLTFANGGELGGLFVVVLVAALAAQEYTWRTVHLWLSRGVERGAYLLAKFGGIVLALFLLALTALVVGGVVTGIYTWKTVGALPWHAMPWAEAGLGVFKIVLTMLPYAGLTLAVAVLSRSTMVAIGVGLGYSLLVENLAVEVLVLLSPGVARVARYLPTMLAKSVVGSISATEMAVSVGMQGGDAPSLLSPGLASVLLVGYALMGLAVAWWAFRRQDISA
ncbi:MAG: ABC transporter permease subunit [Chloroflexi bacterium]|nr:ABC transporter permease subunit [Chloroflexota bacterium]